jgi:hypothetical protein
MKIIQAFSGMHEAVTEAEVNQFLQAIYNIVRLDLSLAIQLALINQYPGYLRRYFCDTSRNKDKRIVNIRCKK